jgi:L-iditol 2-dehydrogenase
MRTILFKDNRGAYLSKIPVPEISEGEALIAVEACGLCGTDLMKLKTQTPGILGHELSGRIAKLGRKVQGFKEGDRVIAAHHVPCLDCHYCFHGNFSMCRQFKSTNFDPGGFSEYLRLSELHVRHTMLKIPHGLDSIAACQTEPLACCLRNVKRLGLKDGDTAGIVGLGSIGLLTAMLLKHFGVYVLGLDIDDKRAQALARWGTGFRNPGDMEEALQTQTGGRGLDALILSAGPASLAAEKLSWIRDGGTLNIFASFHPPQMSLDLNQLYHRELTVMSSYSPSLEDLQESLELIASGALPVSSLKIRTYDLEEFNKAENDLHSLEVMKAIFLPTAVAAR